jgi:radical SAM superfamily enzyme YgiQ (UPF0313 family)
MKITLIQPTIGKVKNESYVRSWSMYPLNLAVLAGLTPESYSVDFIDDRLGDIDYDASRDLVAISTETYTAKRAYSIADEFRKRNVPVVLGGIHPTLMPQEAKQHADALVIGDSEQVWPVLLEDVRRKQLRKEYNGNIEGKVLAHVSPRRDIFQGRKYLPVDLVETGRGCNFSCDFCAVTATYGGTYRTKQIEAIVQDVESLEGRNIYFVDDNFISDSRRTKELCRALTPLKIRWTSQGSVNMAEDPELLAALKKSGCFNMLIGFESLNKNTLELMGKSWATARRSYEESIKKIRDHGITLYATFVFGYDTDTKDDFKRTLDFAIDQKFAITAFNHLVPFPGTPLYARLKDQGRLLYDNWWLRDNGKFGEVVFQPKNMSPEELGRGCFEAREVFYSYGSVFKRLVDFKANAKDPITAGYIAWVNLFSRKEAKRRQGWPIGEVIQDGTI